MRKQIRVLHIVPSINYSNGIMSMLMNYYREIDKTSIQFDFLYCFNNNEDGYEKEIRMLGGNCFYLGTPSFSVNFQKKISYFFQTHSDIKIVHCHTIWSPEVFGSAAKKNGIKCIVAHAHGVKFSDNGIISEIRNFLLNKFVFFFATDYMACSKEAALSFWGKYRTNKGKVTILKNAIDFSRYQFSNEEKKQICKRYNPNDDFIVCHVGRLSKEKNQEFIIKFFFELQKKISNSKLWLIGGGDITPYEKIVSDLGINDKVVFWGNCSNVEIMLQAANVFCFPSLNEGFGLALIEAQAAGLPCLASNNVPRETNITNTVQYLPIDNIITWVDFVVRIYESSAWSNDIILKMQYDIKNVAKELEIYYKTKVYNNGNERNKI